MAREEWAREERGRLAQRRRSLALAAALAGVVVLLYLVSLVKMGR